MFISKAEKQDIANQLAKLTSRISDLDTVVLAILKTMGSKVKAETSNTITIPKKKRGGYVWTDAQRAAQSERIKEMHRRKKEVKA